MANVIVVEVGGKKHEMLTEHLPAVGTVIYVDRHIDGGDNKKIRVTDLEWHLEAPVEEMSGPNRNVRILAPIEMSSFRAVFLLS